MNTRYYSLIILILMQEGKMLMFGTNLLKELINNKSFLLGILTKMLYNYSRCRGA